jgi:hypothetical protein
VNKRKLAFAAWLALTAWCCGTATAQTEDCISVLARVDSKLANFAPHYPGAALHAKTLRDKGADHCQIGEKAQALDALKDAEYILDRTSSGG